MIYEPMRIPPRSGGGALPTYQRQVAAHAPGSGVSARVDDAPGRIAAAGADMKVRAMAGLGKAATGAVETGVTGVTGVTGIRAYDDYSKSRATELITRYRREMNQALYGEGGILTRQGEEALDADGQRAARAAKLRGELLKDAGEETRFYFTLLADDFDADSSLKAQKYAGEQREVMLNRNDEAASQERAEWAMASFARQQDFDRGLGEGLWHAKQIFRRKGYGGEALQRGLRQFCSAVYAGAISQALAGGDVASAERLLTRGSVARDGRHSLSPNSDDRSEDELANAVPWSHMSANDIADARLRIQSTKEALEAKAGEERARQARALLAGLDEAEDAAWMRGDASPLRATADSLRKLGMEAEADEARNRAQFWSGQPQAAAYVRQGSLPELRARMDELRGLLDSETEDGERRRLSGELEAMTRIFGTRLKAYRDDPARAAASVVTLPGNATPEDVARLRVERERADGVPPDALLPLTREEAGKLAGQWASLPAAERPAFLETLRAYGDYAPLVMTQAGISTLAQDLAFSTRGDPRAGADAARVFAVMALDEKEIPQKDVTEDLRDVMSQSAAYRIHLERARGIPSPGQWETVREYEQAAARLLKTGETPREVSRILNAGREGLSGPNMAVLVPAAWADAVEDCLKNALEDRLSAFVRAAASAAADAGISDDGPDDAAEYAIKAELRRIRATGLFVNSPDGSRFTLLDGVTGLPYRNGEGRAFSVSMREVEERDARTLLAEARGARS